jgi:hypothetical protein
MEGSLKEEAAATELCGAIEVREDRVRAHLSEVVRETVEETLNAMLEADADRLCRAGRYERSVERASTRAGSYSRKLQTKAGEVALKGTHPTEAMLTWSCLGPQGFPSNFSKETGHGGARGQRGWRGGGLAAGV